MYVYRNIYYLWKTSCAAKDLFYSEFTMSIMSVMSSALCHSCCLIELFFFRECAALGGLFQQVVNDMKVRLSLCVCVVYMRVEKREKEVPN